MNLNLIVQYHTNQNSYGAYGFYSASDKIVDSNSFIEDLEKSVIGKTSHFGLLVIVFRKAETNLLQP